MLEGARDRIGEKSLVRGRHLVDWKREDLRNAFRLGNHRSSEIEVN